MSKRKYEFTGETMMVGDHKLRRIIAVRDFWKDEDEEETYVVNAGDIGGWIESEENLSQDGECWVFEDAKVYGNARVSGNAWISDIAEVFGNAEVSGNAFIFEKAKVHECAIIFGRALIYGNAEICGTSYIRDDARISGNAIIKDGYVNCDVRIAENGIVTESCGYLVFDAVECWNISTIVMFRDRKDWISIYYDGETYTIGEFCKFLNSENGLSKKEILELSMMLNLARVHFSEVESC